MEDLIYKELLRIAANENIEVIDYMLTAPSLKGLYIQNGDIQVISLNVNLANDPVLRNFILAHELGHAALHKGKIDQELYFNSKEKNYKNIIEKQADNYAYKLLDEIRKNKQSYKIYCKSK